jgi:tetratricopeptide (TPR) repeat protein
MARVETSSLESLQVLLQQNPDSLTFAHVADVLLTSGRLEEATRICEEGIRRHPYYVTGHMVLGKCYLQKKQFDQAEKEFKRVLLFDPKHLAAHKNFGDLMRQMGWENTCETSYRKILQIDPLDKLAQEVLDELSNKPSQARATADVPPEVETPVPPRIEKTFDTGVSTIAGMEPYEPEPRVPASPARSADSFIGRGDDFASFTPPVTPAPPSAGSPFDDNDLFATASAEEQKLLNPPPEPPEMTLPPSKPQTPVRREIDEDKFASILDDIFQDEVVDDRQRVERPPHLEPPQQDMDDESDFGFDDALSNAPSRTPEAPRPTPPVRPPVDDFDDEILGPPRPPLNDERPAFTANLSDEEMPSVPGTGNMAFMEIDGLEPEPPDSEPTAEEIPFRLEPSRPAPPMPGIQSRRGGTTIGATTVESGKSLEPAAPARSAGSSPGEREKIVTPTLGEIYAAQGQFAKAIGVFELLLRKEPNNRAYRDKIEYLKKRLEETEHAG